jgi:hypothetical protein
MPVSTKSIESKVAKKIVDAMNVKSLDHEMVAYFMTMHAGQSEQDDLFDLFLHLCLQIAADTPNGYEPEPRKKIRLLSETIVTAVKRAGYSFYK